MSRLQTFMFWFLMAGLTVFLGIVGIWLFLPENPLVVDETGIEILTPQVKAGEKFRYRVKIFLRGDYPAILGGSFIGETGKVYTTHYPETGALPLGCHDLVIEVPTQKDMDPGEYKYRRISSFQVNPVYIARTGYTTPSFEVVP
jgi:hypothetical protein